MDDRTMLMRAAQVAGVPVKWAVDYGCFSTPWKAADGTEMPCRWNPITSDGDNRRLQLAIGAKAWFERNAAPEMGLPRECGVAVVGDQWWVVNPTNGMSEAEAVNRAVVLAAAAIQQSKESSDG